MKGKDLIKWVQNKCSFCAFHNKKSNSTWGTFTDMEVHTDKNKRLWIWTGESMDYVDENDDVTGRYYPKYCPECGRKLDYEYEEIDIDAIDNYTLKDYEKYIQWIIKPDVMKFPESETFRENNDYFRGNSDYGNIVLLGFRDKDRIKKATNILINSQIIESEVDIEQCLESPLPVWSNIVRPSDLANYFSNDLQLQFKDLVENLGVFILVADGQDRPYLCDDCPYSKNGDCPYPSKYSNLCEPEVKFLHVTMQKIFQAFKEAEK